MNLKDSTIKILHRHAMDIAQEAMLECDDEAVRLYVIAYSLEENCAKALAPTKDNEPSRSVLYRSASALANNARQPRWALDCATRGLDGVGVPPEIRDELLDEIERAVKLLREDGTVK